jgi:hypothetical protein
MAALFDKPRISVKMSDFKMADDMQKKSMIVNAASGGVADSMISRKTAVKELGFDPDVEYENKMNELKKMIELSVNEQEGMAEARGAAGIVDGMYRADAEIGYTKKMDANQQNMAAENDLAKRQQSVQNYSGLQQEVLTQFGNNGASIPHLIMAVTKRMANLSTSNPGEFKIRMLILKNSMPSLYQEVFKNLKEMNLIAADAIPDMEAVNKYTPGQIPSNSQGDEKADDPPSPAMSGAEIQSVQQLVPPGSMSNPAEDNPVMPPRGMNASI